MVVAQIWIVYGLDRNSIFVMAGQMVIAVIEPQFTLLNNNIYTLNKIEFASKSKRKSG